MFKEFSLGELFEASKGDVDLQQKDINGKGHYFINSGLDNRGIKGKTDRPAKVFPANTITIDFWGNAYYRDFEYKLATHNHVFSLTGEVIKDIATGLYIESLMSEFPKMFSYNNMATWNKLKMLKILLPVKKSAAPNHDYTIDDIDYEYMRSRIAELERSRIAELDAYLKATGLEDYELTEEDREVLLHANEKKFSTFRVGDIFTRVTAKNKNRNFNKRKDTSSVRTEEFNLPLVNAKIGDNGIMFYGKKTDWNTQSMCIDVIQNGAVATGTVYAQPQETGVLWDAYLIRPNFKKLSEEILLYFATSIQKVTKEQFSYDKKATWDRVKECEICLPINEKDEIDLEFIENYIRVIKKVTIADVVKYKDKVIETTKAVVEQ